MSRIHLPPLDHPVEDDRDVHRRALARTRWLGAGLVAMLAIVGVRGAQLGVWPSERTLIAAAVQRWDMVMEQAPRGLIVDRTGLRVLRDPYSKKPFVLFYVTERVGGGVQDYDAIKFLRFAA